MIIQLVKLWPFQYLESEVPFSSAAVEIQQSQAYKIFTLQQDPEVRLSNG